MKIKIVSVISIFLLSLIPTFSIASAKDINANTNSINSQAQINTTSTVGKMFFNATSVTAKNNNPASTSVENKGKLIIETLSSTTPSAQSLNFTRALLTQSLLDIASRESGIGSQVSEIAKTQNDSILITASAMINVEKKSPIKTFFLGSDYKNLGVIRSELATTSNNIAKLKSLLDKTTSNADKTLLNDKIQVLEVEQTKLNTYVTAHENTFSLFGWFTKLFVK